MDTMKRPRCRPRRSRAPLWSRTRVASRPSLAPREGVRAGSVAVHRGLHSRRRTAGYREPVAHPGRRARRRVLRRGAWTGSSTRRPVATCGARSRSPRDPDGTQAAPGRRGLAGRPGRDDGPSARPARARVRRPTGAARRGGVRRRRRAGGCRRPRAAMEQLFGGLVKKAFKAATSLAKAGLADWPRSCRWAGSSACCARWCSRCSSGCWTRRSAGCRRRSRARLGHWPAKLGLGEDETTDAFALGRGLRPGARPAAARADRRRAPASCWPSWRRRPPPRRRTRWPASTGPARR